MKRGRERKLEAYRDGALCDSDRERIERRLEQDPEEARYLERSVALGSLIREAWSEGPPAPSVERLLASIAPEMRRIDAGRVPSTTAARAIDSLLARLRDGLDALGGKWIAAGGALAAVFAAFLLAPTAMDPSTGTYMAAAVEQFVAAPNVPMRLASEGPELIGELAWPSAVYDLAQEGVPLMVSEKDGAIVILLGEPEPPAPVDDLSSSGKVEDWA